AIIRSWDRNAIAPTFSAPGIPAYHAGTPAIITAMNGPGEPLAPSRSSRPLWSVSHARLEDAFRSPRGDDGAEVGAVRPGLRPRDARGRGPDGRGRPGRGD